MSRSPFDRNFSNLDNSDIIRNLQEFFKNEAIDLPEKTNLDFSRWPLIVKHAYCEAVLLRKIVTLEKPFNCPSECLNMRIFGDGTPCLSEFLDCHEAGTAVFPTCSESKVFSWRMYVFKSQNTWDDHKKYLVGSEIIKDNCVFIMRNDFSALTEKIDGNSWQLAYQMAVMAMKEKKPKYLNELAFHALITGGISANHVIPVKIGNKKILFEKTPTRVKIIMPGDNHGDYSGKNTNGENNVHYVENVNRAWEVVSGQGVKNAEISLPEDLENLEVLVGGSIRPVLMVILLLNPKNVTLWCSEKTLSHGERICNILNGIEGVKFNKIKSETMNSSSLSQIYNDLRKSIITRSDSTVISNTGGNRLMGIGAVLVARVKNLKIVYRDILAGPDILTAIQFDADENPESCDISVNRCPVYDKINWEWLREKSSDNDDQNVEEVLQNLLANQVKVL